MDAFIRAVEDARTQLIRQTGQNVSVRELIRMAGYDDSQRAAVAYHLTPSRHRGDKPHRVPAELVRRLAAVLPVSEDELTRAAQVAAGFNVVEQDVPDVAYVVQRFYDQDDVTPEEKAAVTARLLQILTEETARDGTAGAHRKGS